MFPVCASRGSESRADKPLGVVATNTRFGRSLRETAESEGRSVWLCEKPPDLSVGTRHNDEKDRAVNIDQLRALLQESLQSVGQREQLLISPSTFNYVYISQLIDACYGGSALVITDAALLPVGQPVLLKTLLPTKLPLILELTELTIDTCYLELHPPTRFLLSAALEDEPQPWRTSFSPGRSHWGMRR